MFFLFWKCYFRICKPTLVQIWNFFEKHICFFQGSPLWFPSTQKTDYWLWACFFLKWGTTWTKNCLCMFWENLGKLAKFNSNFVDLSPPRYTLLTISIWQNTSLIQESQPHFQSVLPYSTPTSLHLNALITKVLPTGHNIIWVIPAGKGISYFHDYL